MGSRACMASALLAFRLVDLRVIRYVSLRDHLQIRWHKSTLRGQSIRRHRPEKHAVELMGLAPFGRHRVTGRG
jgi:hypothetical protein